MFLLQYFSLTSKLLHSQAGPAQFVSIWHLTAGKNP